MAQLTFSDPEKGTIHIQGLSPRKPFEEAAQLVRHQVKGIPLTGWEGPYAPEEGPWLLTWQGFRLVFDDRANRIFRPPFRFSVRGSQEDALPTDPISPHLYVATCPAQIASGFVEIVLYDAQDRLIWQWETEIFPHLFGYRRHDRIMVRQLQTALYGLAFRPQGTPYLRLQPSLEKVSSLPMDLLEQVEAFNKLLPLLDKQFDKRPRAETIFVPIQRLGGSVPRLQSAQLWKSATHEKGDAPLRPDLPLRQLPIATYTPHLSHPLNQWLAQRLDVLARQLAQRSEETVQATVAHIQRMLARWTQAGLGKATRPIPRPSYLPPLYQVFALREQALYQRMMLWDQGWYRLPPKTTATLYEYWCFIEMVRIIEALTQSPVRFQTVIDIQGREPAVRLQQGQAIHCEWQVPRGLGKVILWYQPRLETPRQDQIQQPDILLELFKPGHSQPFCFVFDAKYRLKQPDQASGPPADALDQLHRYRDRIEWNRNSLPDRELGRKIIGGALLFPFPGDPQDMVLHPDYQALLTTHIGAIPLTPGQYGGDSLLKAYLTDLLAIPAEGLYEQIVDYDRREHQMLVEEFEVWLTVRDIAAPPLPTSSGVILIQGKHLHSYRLPNQQDWYDAYLEVNPQEVGASVSLGQLKQALAYKQADILSLSDYGSFRLWQEIYQLDKELRVWEDQGLLYLGFSVQRHHFRCIYGAPIRLVFPDGRVTPFEHARQLKFALPF